MPIKAIFFDLDDTLHDHQKPFSNTFNQVFTNFQKEPSLEILYKKFRYFSDLLWEDYIQNKLTLDELREQRIVQLLNSYQYEISIDLAKQFQLQYESALTSIELFSNVPPLLIKLSNMGYDLGIITNGPTLHQSNKIKSLGLTKYIPNDRIFISDEVGSAKPDPYIFDQAAKKLSYSPEQLLYIGDSWANDIVGAHNAGWNSIWFNHRKRKAETDHKPLLEIFELDAIMEVLEEKAIR